METAIKVSGVVLIGAVASLLLREKNKTASLAAVTCAVITVFLYCTKTGLYRVIADVSKQAEGSFSGAFSEAFSVLLKALGISYITGVTAELCNSAGENSLAAAVGFAGKTEILLLCLPMAAKLLQIAGDSL